ncbi:MAG: hypothetical protein H0U49_10650 [Parachlamydiaceae bacterium]|nr:hypothetical protein [Parachlamydiaceae bacterium]
MLNRLSFPHKFIIFSSNNGSIQVVVTGSCNLTGSAFDNNLEAISIIRDPEIIRCYQKNFIDMFK